MEKKHSRLFKITCNMNYCFDAYVRPEPWLGLVLLYDDGYFEGIPYAEDPVREEYENFICGVYHPDKGIDITMVEPERYDSAIHVRAYANKEGGYFGDIADVNFFGENSIGSCDVTFESMGVFEYLTGDLTREVCLVKGRLMGYDNHKFTEEVYNNRDTIVREIVDYFDNNDSKNVPVKKKTS